MPSPRATSTSSSGTVARAFAYDGMRLPADTLPTTGSWRRTPPSPRAMNTETAGCAGVHSSSIGTASGGDYQVVGRTCAIFPGFNLLTLSVKYGIAHVGT